MTRNLSLLPGEEALDDAPHAKLPNGIHCIPQHYLRYHHTLASVEAIVCDIEYDERYLVFVSEDTSCLYIQIGIIGYDNYTPRDQQDAQKIVYGRKWRVEPQLPTSEIIQTVFLALKKAREHEIRELFQRLTPQHHSTPMNNHHDLPLLAQHSATLTQTNNAPLSPHDMTCALKTIHYDNCRFELIDAQRRPTGFWLVELRVTNTANTQLPELKQAQYLTLNLEHATQNALIYQLMAQLIALSDRHVDEHFHYQNFKRFSWYNSVDEISHISANTRQLHKHSPRADFFQRWQEVNYQVDATRTPKLHPGPLAKKVKRQIKPFTPLAGFSPSHAV